MIAGDKNVFAIECKKRKEYSEMRLYIEEKDILQYEYKDMINRYRWYNFDDIVEWLEENLKYILSFDDGPIEPNVKNAIKFIIKCQKDSNTDISLSESISDWCFRHGWLNARAGSFLASLIFRRVNNYIEISWNNSNSYRGNPKFIYDEGCYYIDIDIFKEVMMSFIDYYKNKQT